MKTPTMSTRAKWIATAVALIAFAATASNQVRFNGNVQLNDGYSQLWNAFGYVNARQNFLEGELAKEIEARKSLEKEVDKLKKQLSAKK